MSVSNDMHQASCTPQTGRTSPWTLCIRNERLARADGKARRLRTAERDQGCIVMTTERPINRLRNLELFAGCRPSELRQIDQLLVTLDVPAGRTLCTEGTRGREFFVLVDGVANLHASNGDAALLSAGSWFGDRALLEHAQRDATITTVTDTTLLVFGQR